MNFRNFPKAEAAAVAAIAMMFALLAHYMSVTGELLQAAAEPELIDAYDRAAGNFREAVLWMLGLSFGYVGVKRLTSKPEVIRAEAEARAVSGPESE